MSFGLYVHFPWCLQRCPYCDFATAAARLQDIPHAVYADAVLSEARIRARSFPGSAATLYFGGGTPSLWEPSELSRVIRELNAQFGPVGELTVECNPTSLDASRAEAFARAGVTRVSIGVQSLRDAHLRYLGRLHDADGARRALRTARSVGGFRVSADLMYGMPDQRADELVADVDELVDAGAEHVSAYALTIEPATRFGELARSGRLPRLEDAAVVELGRAVDTALRARGFEHYEISNWALPGAEAQHNRAYWHGAPYMGLGRGAVGCWSEGVGRSVRYRNPHDNGAPMLAAFAVREAETEVLDAPTLVREGLMLGLRTRDGVDLEALRARTGVDPRVGRERALAGQLARGNVTDAGARWSIPPERWAMADGIIAALF